MSVTTGIQFAELPETYAELVAFHMLRPIHDDVECENATEIIDAMAGHDLNDDQEDYLDLLSDLVDKYESEQVEVAAASPLAALQMLMDENGMNASDLGRLLGERSLGPKILNGDRGLSKAHIRALAERFKVNPSLFL